MELNNLEQSIAMSNIVKFPGLHRHAPPQSEEEMHENIRRVRETFITKNAVDMAFNVFQELENSGIDISEDDKMQYDLILISESIKAAMFRSLKMKHPLHEFSENIINLNDSDIQFENLDE